MSRCDITDKTEKIKDDITAALGRLEDAASEERQTEADHWAGVLLHEADKERAKPDASEAIALTLERVSEAISKDSEELIERI